MDVIGLFRQTTCSASASIHYNTLKLGKIYSYGDARKIVKTLIVHHLLLILSSVQTAYRETGVSNRSISFTKIIYTGAYMILDTQNLHTFSQSPSNSSFASLEALVYTPFSCLLTCRRREVRSFVVIVVRRAVWLPALLLCVRFFERLTVAGNWTHWCTQYRAVPRIFMGGGSFCKNMDSYG